MKKLIQKWLGITDLQDRDKKLGDILVPYHVETDKIPKDISIARYGWGQYYHKVI